MRYFFYLSFVLSALVILIIFSCTSNPFSKDNDIEEQNRSITGTIELGDHTIPDGIYVWLESFDLSTYTNSDGFFSLTLPAPSQNAGDINGMFVLYFYMTNYQMDSVQVAVRNGQVVYSEGNLDSKGSIKKKIVLSKLLDLNIKVTPSTIPADYDSILQIEMRITGPSSPVGVVTFVDSNNAVSGIYFKKTDSEEEVIKTYFSGRSYRQTINISHSPSTHIANIKIMPCTLPTGEYEVFPYLWVTQTNLPAEMLDDFGADATSMSYSYTRLPFKRTGGVLNITTALAKIGGGCD